MDKSRVGVTDAAAQLFSYSAIQSFSHLAIQLSSYPAIQLFSYPTIQLFSYSATLRHNMQVYMLQVCVTTYYTTAAA